jgi:hypothetical protein
VPYDTLDGTLGRLFVYEGLIERQHGLQVRHQPAAGTASPHTEQSTNPTLYGNVSSHAPSSISRLTSSICHTGAQRQGHDLDQNRGHGGRAPQGQNTERVYSITYVCLLRSSTRR